VSLAGEHFNKDEWNSVASNFFQDLARVQRPDGTFLAAGRSDNPETVWFHELVLLHAAASYGAEAGDATLAAAASRAAEYHQAETQPDHATSQPWGLFAFIRNPRTRPLADQILHATQVQHPGGPGGITYMLLADVLYCLQVCEGGRARVPIT
jgi:hypothetical protein